MRSGESPSGPYRIDFKILGPLAVTVDGMPVEVGRRREAALLARLLVGGGDAVSDAELLESVWESDELKDPIHALRTTVSRLRRALGPAGAELITRTSRGYQLDMSAATLDSDRFGALVRRAEAEPNPGARVDLLDDALSLWRGPALAEFTTAHFALAASIRLEEQRLNAVEALMLARLDLGDDATLIPTLEQTLADHPLREQLWQALMLALYRAGRQGEALRAFQRARHGLSAIGLEPCRALSEMEEAILRQDPALNDRMARDAGTVIDEHLSTHLPAIGTSFVGRGSDMSVLADLVRRKRWVTVTGPAGVGKSRLAIEVGRTVSPVFGDGVCYVDLHAHERPFDVPAAVQSGLSLWGMLRPELDSPAAPVPQLVNTLRTKDHLLILDGCERVASETAELADELLRECPRLHVLATSTTPLARDDEVVFRIAPLSVDRLEPGASELDGAMRLFADRARLVASGFEITDANRDVVAEIVTKLDGLPLAIELAAARSGSIPLARIAERLDSLLQSESSAGRGGRTIETTLQWSYEQLPPRDRAIFDCTSTFVGSWDVEIAAAVCCEDPSSIEAAVARLLELSLVHRVADTADVDRYAMLGVVRTFGLGNLDRAGLTHETAGRAAHHLRRELRARVRRLAGPEEGQMLAWFRHSIDDLVAGFEWLLDHDPAAAVQGAAWAGWFWIRLGYPNAARAGHSPKLRLDAAPKRHAALASLIASWADLLSRPVIPGSRQFVLPLVDSRATLGRTVEPTEVPGSAIAWAEKALGLFAEAGAERGIATATSGLALAIATDGRFDEATVLASEAIERHVAAGSSSWDIGSSQLVAANVALGRGDVAAAVGLANLSLTVFVALDDGFMAAWNHDTLARAAIIQGRLDDAEAHWIEALACRPHSHPARVLIPCWLGLLKMNRGLFDEAGTYFADALKNARTIGTDDAMVAVRLCLGEWHSQRGDHVTARAMYQQAAKLTERGEASLAEAVRLALAVADVRDEDFDSARRQVRQELRSWMEAPDNQVPVGAKDVLAACALAEGRPVRAAVLSGARDSAEGVLFLRILLGHMKAEVAAAVDDALGREVAQEAAGVGSRLGPAELVEFALSDDDRPGTGVEPPTSWGTGSSRRAAVQSPP